MRLHISRDRRGPRRDRHGRRPRGRAAHRRAGRGCTERQDHRVDVQPGQLVGRVHRDHEPRRGSGQPRRLVVRRRQRDARDGAAGQPRHARRRPVRDHHRVGGRDVPQRVGPRRRREDPRRATPPTSAAPTRSTSSTVRTRSPNLVDRLTYNDQGTGTVKGPRTQGVAGIPKTDAALGANDASQWQLSAVGDAEGSWASTHRRHRLARARAASRRPARRARLGEHPHQRGLVGQRQHARSATRSSCTTAAPPTSASPAGCRSTAALPPRRPRSRRSCADGTATTVVPAHGYVYFALDQGSGQRRRRREALPARRRERHRRHAGRLGGLHRRRGRHRRDATTSAPARSRAAPTAPATFVSVKRQELRRLQRRRRARRR